MTKYIFVTGGVVSSLGKGITAASLAQLLKQRGYRVAMQKLDPYLNVDPGTMSPYQHGEVYVTVDGAETDLDLGHYERIAGVRCTRNSNYTSGKIYSNVIARERAGGYLGGTVQMIPHITNEIKDAMRSLASEEIDIAICEIGGTAGDIESLTFLEAARQFRQEVGRGNAIFIHLTLVPFIRAAGELKTKPSQQSVAILRNIGIVPDILVCRTEVSMEEDHIEKLALFCNVDREFVVEEKDVTNSIYEVPPELASQHLDEKVLKLLNMPIYEPDNAQWNRMLDAALHPTRTCTIGLVGKYMKCRDAYKSIYEALAQAGIADRAKVKVLPIEAETLEEPGAAERLLAEVDGIVVPGGFGSRGVNGKIAAIEYARTHNKPLLGICLGMQCIVIEYARNVLGWTDANSTEFDPESSHPVVDLMETQRGITAKGGTMRLGAYPCKLISKRLQELYNADAVCERHRHRYEFNNKFREEIQKAGLVISGTSPDDELVEIVELPQLKYFVGCQFHPEFQTQVTAPNPLFKGLIDAVLSEVPHA